MKGTLSTTIGMVTSTCVLLCYYGVAMVLRYDVPMLLNWMGICILVYAIYTYKEKTKGRWFSPYTILMLFFTLFNYGQPIMWALGIHKTNEIGTKGVYTTSYFPTSNDLIAVQMYVCTAMLLFHFGVLLCTRKKEKDLCYFEQHHMNTRFVKTKKAMLMVCRALVIVLTPVALYSKFNEMTIARTYGYGALYYGSYSTQGGYMQIAMYLFFPALVGCLIACDYSKKSRMYVYTIFGIYAFLGLLTGDRGGWLYSLVILIWVHTHYKKTPMRTYLLIGGMGIVGLYVLKAFTAVRNAGLTVAFQDVITLFRAEESPIVDACFEMGGSMGIITYFLHAGNDIYPYPNTYLTAVLGVISSRVLQILGLKQVLISNWFSQDYLGLRNYGTGFSMLGEAYVNGGYFGGLIYMCLLGMVHGKLLGKMLSGRNERSPLALFISVAGLNAVIGFARGAMYLVLKELFYGVFIVWILIKIAEKSIRVD